jgi:hypothetical protein
MTNPLIDKYFELYPEKKEEPKVIKAENAKIGFELKPEFLEQLANKPSITSVASNHTTPAVATSNTGITKASPIKSYDKHSANDVFLELAEKVKNGTAQVNCVSLQFDAIGGFSCGKRITFEVYDYEP